jgi:hypothetical protein
MLRQPIVDGTMARASPIIPNVVRESRSIGIVLSSFPSSVGPAFETRCRSIGEAGRTGWERINVPNQFGRMIAKSAAGSTRSDPEVSRPYLAAA